MKNSNYNFMQVTFYWMTQRVSTADQVFISIDSFYLYRTIAPLVA